MTPEELEAMKQREAKASRTPFYPGDLDTYGVPVEKHEDRVSLQSLDGFAGQLLCLSRKEDSGSLFR